MNDQRTFIDPEDYAYPRGGFTRRARVEIRRNEHNPIDLPYGSLRMVRASIPDTFCSIPARFRYRGRTVRGFIGSDDGVLYFMPEADPTACREQRS